MQKKNPKSVVPKWRKLAITRLEPWQRSIFE